LPLCSDSRKQFTQQGKTLSEGGEQAEGVKGRLEQQNRCMLEILVK